MKTGPGPSITKGANILLLKGFSMKQSKENTGFDDVEESYIKKRTITLNKIIYLWL